MSLIDHTAITKLHLSQRLRGVLLFEIVIVFSLYMILFGVVNFFLNRQATINISIQNRLATGGNIQSLERLMLQRSTFERSYELSRNNDDRQSLITAYREYEALSRQLQRYLVTVKTSEAAQIDQETYFIGEINKLNFQLTAILERLTQTDLNETAEPIGLTEALGELNQNELVGKMLSLEHQSLNYLSGWRTVVDTDIERLTTALAFYRQLGVGALAIQALLVIVSLVVIAYTYVSPAFERLLKKVIRQNEQLKEVDILKNEFLSIASHQLRTPLAELKWNLTLLTRQAKSSGNRQQQLIAQASASTETMIRLVTSLLNLNRIEQNRLEFHPQPTNIVAIIKTTMRELKEPAKQKNITLTSQFNRADTTVVVDPLLFKQVVENLLHNAVHYNRPHGKVNVSVIFQAKAWKMVVSDNGLGIKPEEKNRLFTKFFRSSEAIKLYPDGSGLGLYFVKRIVERHRGKIEVQSQVGKGTTITLTFPALIRTKIETNSPTPN